MLYDPYNSSDLMLELILSLVLDLISSNFHKISIAVMHMIPLNV